MIAGEEGLASCGRWQGLWDLVGCSWQDARSMRALRPVRKPRRDDWNIGQGSIAAELPAMTDGANGQSGPMVSVDRRGRASITICAADPESR